MALDWSFIGWVKSITKLPIILKGILSVEDAKLAVKYEADAIWISNHGGRQLDTVLSTVDCLAEITKLLLFASKMDHPPGKTRSRPYVFIDSGVRTGFDIFKCLALGADYVFVGRPLVYSLVEGEEGVNNMVDILTDELQEAMRLTGSRTLADVGRSNLKMLHAGL